MTLRRADIVAALQDFIQQLPFSPPTVDVDAEDIAGWSPVSGASLQHAGNIVSGRFEPTIDGGSSTEWEGVRSCTFSYAVTGANRPARIAQRDLAVPALATALAANRTLTPFLDDPQVWVELGSTVEDDDAPVADAGAASVAHIEVNVTYVAASAAG